jgi:hypothetical protein
MAENPKPTDSAKSEDSGQANAGSQPTRGEYLERRLRLFFFFYFALFIAGFLVYFTWPLRAILVDHEKLLDARLAGLNTIPDIENRLADLSEKQQLLTTTSVGSRLDAIEAAMRLDTQKPAQVASLQDVRRDVDKFKAYVSTDPDKVMALKRLQDDYHRLADASAAKEFIDTELSYIHNLIKGTWAIGAIVLGLTWFLLPRLIERQRAPIPTEPVSKPAPPAVDSPENLDAGKDS